MKANTIQRAARLLIIAASFIAPSLQAQQPGMQASLGSDVGTLSDKFTGLAKVLDGKYDYRPGQGVRSTADVLNLIVMENGLLAGVLMGAAPGARPAPVTDPAKMQDALRNSYANLKKVIEGLSDTDLSAPVKMFGRDTTKRGAIAMALNDQHEHLGQLIAYSRVNGIVPPWSK
jgi:uncharacterized damage-inducible protein DinB